MPPQIDLEQFDTDELAALREQVESELSERRQSEADDPAEVIETFLEDALETLRGRTKMPKSPDVGPALKVHNGVPVTVCYKGDTSRKNSVSRWVQVNDEWVWDSDRTVADLTDFPSFERGYNGKISVFALDLNPGDEVEVRRKSSHGNGSETRKLYDFDGNGFERV